MSSAVTPKATDVAQAVNSPPASAEPRARWRTTGRSSSPRSTGSGVHHVVGAVPRETGPSRHHTASPKATKLTDRPTAVRTAEVCAVQPGPPPEADSPARNALRSEPLPPRSSRKAMPTCSSVV